MATQIAALQKSMNLGMTRKVVLDGDVPNALMDDGKEGYFLPIPVTDILSSLYPNASSLYVTGVAVELTAIHSRAVDFAALCGRVNFSHKNMMQPAMVTQSGRGYFPVCSSEVQEGSLHVNLKSSDDSLVESVVDSFFAGKGRDGSVFGAPLKSDQTLYKGDSTVGLRRKKDHEGRVECALMRQGDGQSVTYEERMVRDNVRVYWKIEKKIDVRLGPAQECLGLERIWALCCLRPQVQTLMPLKSAKHEGADGLFRSGMMSNIRVTFHLRG